ncbi:MAG: RNA-guided pseudouridylation complex pseudouridine synthase subunit Cbf5 [Euryarchaeota archaeon]|nr:RNA-guided pseudouridylation complex pseudouridine synthase subunit Cbf5 [Euryarchaeota archaeon]
MGTLPSEKGRKIIAIRKSTTDPAYGKPPGERTVEELLEYGFVNLDKPAGPTSHEVVSWVKDILEVKKAGHGGTLDPGVTGVLPVALNEGVKVVQALLPAGKEYVCVMRLHADVKERAVREVFREFTTEIYQRPPVKSKVKRVLRSRRIYYMDILEIEGRDILFKVGCEAGTYIRKLCHDLGEVLRVGAHMGELRRTKSGPFTEEDIVSLHDLKDAYVFWKENGEEEQMRRVITPVEEAVGFLPRVVLRDSAVDSVCHGAALAVPGLSQIDAEIKSGDLVAMFTLKGELIGLGRARMDTTAMLTEESGIAVKTDRVLMKPGTYPKMWSKDGG